MHKHIQYLAEDAGMDEHKLPHGYERCLAGEDSIEQFAITTVQKCIHLIMMDYCNNGDEWDRALDNSVRNIKEYFGIR